jgi:hypothetical protein
MFGFHEDREGNTRVGAMAEPWPSSLRRLAADHGEARAGAVAACSAEAGPGRPWAAGRGEGRGERGEGRGRAGGAACSARAI